MVAFGRRLDAERAERAGEEFMVGRRPGADLKQVSCRMGLTLFYLSQYLKREILAFRCRAEIYTSRKRSILKNYFGDC